MAERISAEYHGLAALPTGTREAVLVEQRTRVRIFFKNNEIAFTFLGLDLERIKAHSNKINSSFISSCFSTEQTSGRLVLTIQFSDNQLSAQAQIEEFDQTKVDFRPIMEIDPQSLDGLEGLARLITRLEIPVRKTKSVRGKKRPGGGSGPKKRTKAKRR